jgi:hypothetical protein
MRDAVAARARRVGRAVAVRVLAHRVGGAADVEGAAWDGAGRHTTPEVRGPRSGAAGAVAVVRARDALAAGTLAIRRAVAVRVRRVARERRALVAAVGRTRVRAAREGRDTWARQLAVVAIAAAGASAVAPTGHVVLERDLDALAALALVVVRAIAAAGRRAVIGRAVARAEEQAGVPGGRGVRTRDRRAPGVATLVCIRVCPAFRPVIHGAERPRVRSAG